MLHKAWPIAVALAWLVAGPLRAQEAPAEMPLVTGGTAEDAAAPVTAEDVVAAAAERLRPPGVPRPCPQSESGVIVVCAQDDEETQRVDSSSDQAIAAGQAVSDGKPRAPDVFGIPSGGVTIRMGSPPPQVFMIDLKAIPEAPPGSDAARFAEDAVPAPPAAESAE
ncbi:MAG: hypothetical protein B7Z33_02545 [Sphingomonadales bacterium 12-68-11]|nr:MAG: hypothetical protein B7Z33_02545 [Sphingomonadales bacterium 12-68-11]